VVAVTRGFLHRLMEARSKMAVVEIGFAALVVVVDDADERPGPRRGSRRGGLRRSSLLPPLILVFESVFLVGLVSFVISVYIVSRTSSSSTNEPDICSGQRVRREERGERGRGSGETRKKKTSSRAAIDTHHVKIKRRASLPGLIAAQARGPRTLFAPGKAPGSLNFHCFNVGITNSGLKCDHTNASCVFG
jgi:hypothetical protein